MYSMMTSRAYATHSLTTAPSHNIRDTIIYTDTSIKPTAIPPYHNFLYHCQYPYKELLQKGYNATNYSDWMVLTIGSPIIKSSKNAKTGIQT